MGITFNPFTGQLDITGSSGGGGGGSPANRYTSNFNATTDWTLSGAYYQIVIPAATHTRGLNPSVIVLELDGGQYRQVTLDDTSYDASGNVTLQVLATPDLRFLGRAILI